MMQQRASDIPELAQSGLAMDVNVATVKKAIRQAWKRHFGDACPTCNARMHFEMKFRKHRHYATLDHILARSLGGDNSLSNIAVVCAFCNNLKSKDEYRLMPSDAR